MATAILIGIGAVVLVIVMLAVCAILHRATEAVKLLKEVNDSAKTVVGWCAYNYSAHQNEVKEMDKVREALEEMEKADRVARVVAECGREMN
jgi:hypothetical protein